MIKRIIVDNLAIEEVLSITLTKERPKKLIIENNIISPIPTAK